MPLTEFGLSAAAALLLGTILTGILGRRKPEDTMLFGIVCAVCVFLCSRLVYVLGNCTYYLTTLSRPDVALRFWEGGYSMLGAILGVLLACPITAKLTHESPFNLCDDAMCAMLPAIALVRLMLRDTTLGLGKAMGGIFVALDATGELVTSVCLWEMLAALVLFAILLIIRRRATHFLPGDLCLTGLVLFGAVQTLLESLKNDGHLVVHFVRIQQVLSLVLVVTAAIIWTVRRLRHPQMRKNTILLWIVILGGIALAVVQEFAVDSSENLLIDYLLMASALFFTAAMTLRLMQTSPRKEY